jgi:hypothetical protein
MDVLLYLKTGCIPTCCRWSFPCCGQHFTLRARRGGIINLHIRDSSTHVVLWMILVKI